MTGVTVSVLTPTYNRAHVLYRVYESLQRQTVRNFEWVVVDDGSTDGTPDLLTRWQAEADFPVTWYRYSNNRGKSAAVNSGTKLVSGAYTVILDSDDAFLDDAMETIEYFRKESDIDNNDSAYAMVFRYIDDHDNLSGRLFYLGKSETNVMSRLEARYRFEMVCETCIVTKTTVARAEEFVELTASEHCPEIVTHHRIGKKFKSVYINHPIGKCFRYDGIERLTLSSSITWPRGNYLMSLATLNNDIRYFWVRPGVFLKAGRSVAMLGFHIRRSPLRQFRDLTNSGARLLWIAGLPRGFARYIRDRLHGRRALKAHPDISAWGPAAPPETPILRPARQPER